MNTNRLCRLVFVPLMLLSAAQAAWAQAENTATPPAGKRWEVNAQPTMTMDGMTVPMQGRTVKVCAPANPTEPPGSSNDEQGCVGSNFTRDGLKVSWTSVCTGPPAMTGQGELTYKTEAMEAYSGTITYAVEDGTMVINLTGKFIETCDRPMSR
ncbi:MAG TPA: DUF3617 family protein [Xanthomonadales bacterium]|nr:DUF3617 family protein [Xanthomonadales bacterium]